MSYALSLISVKELQMFVIEKCRVQNAVSYALSIISVNQLQMFVIEKWRV